MQVECINTDVADDVQGVFARYGVRTNRQGAFIGTPPDLKVHVSSVGNVPSEKDADVRREIQSIAGAKIAP